MKNVMDIFQSIKRTNGASYNTMTGQLNPFRGYMVALPGFEHVTTMPQSVIDFDLLLRNYIAGKGEHLETGNRFLGLWLKDDKLYIDISEQIHNRDEAIKLGIERNQLAIWDNVCCCEIQTATGQQRPFPKDVELFRQLSGSYNF